MSRHTNNARLPSQLSNDAYAWYIDGDRLHMDLTSPQAHVFPHARNERGGVDPWLWSLQDRILTLPSSMMSFPRPRMRLVVLHNNLANNTNLRSRPTVPSQQQNSELTPDEQRKVFEKFKKEIYNPIPKKIMQRLGRFYRQNGSPKTEKEIEEDDDDKKCVICLEDFEAKEVVMVTPCNHMFHEDCILPWVKSHHRCPICRFSFYERSEASSSTNNNNIVDDRLTNDLISFVTSRGGSTRTTQPFWF